MAQIMTLIDESKDTPIHMQILFNVLMGLRRQEINAVKYSDIDYINRTLSVERQLGKKLNREPKGMDEKLTTKNELPLKTLSSQRKLPIPDYVFEAILEERKKYERNRSRRKYGDNANIIPEEIPELLSYMNEVMPKKEGNDGSDVWEIVIDLNGFLPSKDNS